MSTMIAELYDALIAAGAPEDKAKAAATALAEYDTRFNRIDNQLAQINAELQVVKGEITLLKWMSGFVIAGIVALLVRAFVS